MKLESEKKPTPAMADVGEAQSQRCSAGVLIHNRERIVIAAVVVAATELNALRRVRKGKNVVHVLLRQRFITPMFAWA